MPDTAGRRVDVIEQDGTTVRETTDAPASTPTGEVGQVEVVAQADLLQEYVGASQSSFTPWLGTAYIRQLPNPIDDLMRDFGVRLYDEDMMRDPQVYSTLSALVMAVLCQGLRLNVPMDEGQEGYDQAIKVRDFCQFNLDNMRHSITEILYELTEGMLKVGHKVGEIIYEQKPVEGYPGPQICMVDIKCKSHGATAFVVDGYNNVVGLLYIKPGASLPVLGQGLIDPANPSATSADANALIVPRAKFVIPTHKAKNADPRGSSHLKPVYTPWWKKQQLTPQHMAYVARFAQPSIWANLPETAKDIPITDAQGNVVRYKSIVQATTDALVKIKGGAAASFIGTEVAMLEARSDGAVLFDSYAHEDRQIAKGILLQTLTTEEGQHMARAASAIHEDVFGILIAYIRSSLSWSIRFDILKPLVRYNFGVDESEKFVPEVSLGDTAVQDIPKLMGAIAQLALAQGIHDSQWPKIWPMVGLPDANEEEWAADKEQRNEQRKALADASIAGAKRSITNPPEEGPPGPQGGPPKNAPGGGQGGGVNKPPSPSKPRADKQPTPGE